MNEFSGVGFGDEDGKADGLFRVLNGVINGRLAIG